MKKWVWFYRADQWEKRGLERGGDEYGRNTLVLGTPLGAAVVAYRTCRCSDCALMREQTRLGNARWELHAAGGCDCSSSAYYRGQCFYRDLM